MSTRLKPAGHPVDGEQAAGQLQEVAQVQGLASVEAMPTASAYPPIAEYAFLSDCEVNALLAPGGRVEWLCLPRPDGPSVFGAMLDRAAGSFRFGPSGSMVPAGRRYLPGTLVLETTWRTRTGWMIIRDALCLGPWYHEHRRSGTHRRPPTDHEAEHMLVRTARCIIGTVELSLDCEPVFNYGETGASWSYAGQGYDEAVATGGKNDVPLRLVTDLRVGFEGPGAHATKTLREGETAFAALCWPRSQFSASDEFLAEHPPPKTADEAFQRIERTANFWRGWINHGIFPEHPWQSYLQRSALTLKGLTYAPTGAVLAAATTSLPETPGGERNWDYRYTWIRDSTFMLWGLYTLGFAREANDFFYFMADVAKESDDVQILYGIGGEKQLDERTLDHLSGYEGARPVRVGNGAYSQRQHDVWGALLDSVYLHTRSRDYLPELVWPILRRAVEAAIANWQKPDRGIWEVRGEPRHFTSSKVMCWVALDRGARLAELHADADLAARWQKIADEIHSDICQHGVDERGVFVQHYDSKALDASVLLIPLLRFLAPDDPRIKATVLAIADELTVDGLVLRYKVEETDDGLSGEEGTFAICSFWLVSALVEIGEIARARQLCEKLLSYASPLQLYAEEIDARSGRHLGNFPQAFTHLALINAVMHVIRAESGVDTGQFTPLGSPSA
ncbi:MAG: glycoside hydrolase family 15 protein [Candidatus Dormibacteraeota bacterium]|uniref:Trehalase n=2 Tax=Candidatus Dormiibacter inghamiae TaxID=3127013 RepID=A0A934KDN7_9BACT|nr:glycoside hydrolase family 15 protein [Candidatus Dormibacteraeota bacterium]MBJ7605890.1 glycoside hydrolase family 15 protein [Candidatus Dormibacteraeota bacterium]